MNEIVLINQSSGYLMIDIANAFANTYDKVTLITGRLNLLNRALSNKVVCSNIIKYNKRNSVCRVISWVFGTIQIFWKLIFKYRKEKIFFVTNPPLSYLIATLLKRDYSILIYDIYPDALRNIGITESYLVYVWWAKLNKKVFAKANKIFTLSKGMAIKLSKYIDIDKITIIENWSGSDTINPVKKENNIFLERYNLQNKFIVLYSGNMGFTHNLDVLIEVAIRLKFNCDITFIFIGDGKKRSELIRIKNKNKLINCRFLDWQSPDLLPYSLAAADLGVVTLNEYSAQLSVPSKTYNLMSAGVALLSISPHNSELSELIKIHNVGQNFSNNEIEKICNYILFCKENKDMLRIYSQNSYIASKKYTYKNADLYIH